MSKKKKRRKETFVTSGSWSFPASDFILPRFLIARTRSSA
jgi:hypothetical protein